jgi:hypothetical protein
MCFAFIVKLSILLIHNNTIVVTPYYCIWLRGTLVYQFPMYVVEWTYCAGSNLKCNIESSYTVIFQT